MLALAVFRKAIGPVLVHPVRGRRINDPRFGRVRYRYRFLRGVIRQTKDNEIRIVQGLTTGFKILALVIIQRDQRKFATPRQPIGNFQTGGSGGAINENTMGHNFKPSKR